MNFPPDNFDKLREFLVLLRQGEIDLDIGKKSYKALVSMVNDPDRVAMSNIVELAEETSVSPASITRLARLLGFKGFNQFQQIFKLRAKVPTNYYSQKVIELADEGKLSAKQVMSRQLNSSIKNMQYCIDNIEEEDISVAVRLLARSGRVFVFGHKQSSAMANVLRYGLCLIRHDVQSLGQYEHGLAIALGQLKKNDLVVIFGSSPYSNLTVDIAAMTKQLDCQVLAITDSILSPLNDCSTLSICVPTEGHYYTNSLAANFIFIESLLSLTAVELGPTAINKLKAHESLVTKINANS